MTVETDVADVRVVGHRVHVVGGGLVENPGGQLVIDVPVGDRVVDGFVAVVPGRQIGHGSGDAFVVDEIEYPVRLGPLEEHQAHPPLRGRLGLAEFGVPDDPAGLDERGSQAVIDLVQQTACLLEPVRSRDGRVGAGRIVAVVGGDACLMAQVDRSHLVHHLTQLADRRDDLPGHPVSVCRVIPGTGGIRQAAQRLVGFGSIVNGILVGRHRRASLSGALCGLLHRCTRRP